MSKALAMVLSLLLIGTTTILIYLSYKENRAKEREFNAWVIRINMKLDTLDLLINKNKQHAKSN